MVQFPARGDVAYLILLDTGQALLISADDHTLVVGASQRAVGARHDAGRSSGAKLVDARCLWHELSPPKDECGDFDRQNTYLFERLPSKNHRECRNRMDTVRKVLSRALILLKHQHALKAANEEEKRGEPEGQERGRCW